MTGDSLIVIELDCAENNKVLLGSKGYERIIAVGADLRVYPDRGEHTGSSLSLKILKI